MAWRLEKEPTGVTAIVIDGWDKGIGTNPYDGMFDMRQVNIGTIPGQVSVGFPLTQSTTSGDTLGTSIARATYFYQGFAAAYFILDATGHVFVSTSFTGTFASTSASTTGASQFDSVIAWHGYVFHFRNGHIDYATVSSGGAVGAWTTGWQSYTGQTQANSVIVGRDDVVYFCNGNFVGSIIEKAGQTFDPANSATYTYNAQALALPLSELSTCLEEQGLNLLIGGAQDAVYVWDRIAPTFNNRIYLADRFVQRMVKANTNVYIFCGNNSGGRGRIYVTNGSQASLFFKIPDHITGKQEPVYVWGDAIYHRNKLIFGFTAGVNNTGATITSVDGVWSVDLESNAFCQLSTSLTAAGTANVLIPYSGNSISGGIGYIMASQGGSGSPYVATSSTAAGTGTSVIRTEYIPVGTFLDKRTFTQIEYKLFQPLASGESIQLVMDTIDNNNTVGQDTTLGMISNAFPITVQGAQWLSITINSTGNSASSGVQLKEIRIR